MALRKQIASIPFSDGVAESYDPKMVPNGKLRAVQNAVFDKEGAIEKRTGFAALDTTVLGLSPIYGSVSFNQTKRRLAKRGDELFAWDGVNAFGHQSNSFWSHKGQAGSASTETIPVPQDAGGAIQAMDCAVSGNTLLCIYLFDSGSGFFLYSTAIDISTGGTIFQHRAVDVSGACSAPRLIIVHDTVSGADIFVALYVKSNAVQQSRLSANGLGLNWTAAIVLNPADTGVFDAVSMGNTTYVISSFRSATNQLVSFEYDLSGGVIATAPAIGWTPGTPRAIALEWDGTNVHLAYYKQASGTVEYIRYNAALILQGSVSAGTAVVCSSNERIGLATVGTTTVVFWHELTNSGAGGGLTTAILAWRGVNNSTFALIGGSKSYIVNHFITTRPRPASDSKIYFVTGVDDWYQSIPAFPFKRFAQGLFVARLDPTTVGATTSSGANIGVIIVGNLALEDGLGMITNVAARQMTVASGPDGRDSFYFAQAVATKYFDGANSTKVQYRVYKSTINAIEALTPVDLTGFMMLSGGCPALYDGTLVSEIAWPYPPLIMRLSPRNFGGGALTSNGVYTYQVVLEAWLRDGTIVYSEASLPATTTLGATDNAVDIVYRACSFSNKGIWFPSDYAKLYAVVYRSTIDEPDVLFRVARQQINFTATDYYTLTDAAADLSIEENEQIYTVGGEVDATALPSCSVIAVADQRIMARSDEFKRRVYYSKPFIRTRPPEFNKDFQAIDMPRDIYGIASQAGAWVMIGEDAVFLVEGFGPDVTGRGNPFVARQIAAGVGTRQAMSVAETPIGTFFRCGDLFFLVNAKFVVVDIGADVAETLSGYPEVRRSEVDKENTTVRFLCWSASGTGAVIVTYNWRREAWSFWYPTLQDAVAGSNKPLRDMCRIGSTGYAVAGASPYVESGFADVPQAGQSPFFALVIETADWIVGNIDQYLRAWRCVFRLTRKGAHRIKVSLAINGAAAYVWSKVYTDKDLTLIGENELLDIHIPSGYQLASKVRFKLEDMSPDSGAGSQGFVAHGATLEYGTKDGTLKNRKQLQMG